jgi:hypothetical protein
MGACHIMSVFFALGVACRVLLVAAAAPSMAFAEQAGGF